MSPCKCFIDIIVIIITTYNVKCCCCKGKLIWHIFVNSILNRRGTRTTNVYIYIPKMNNFHKFHHMYTWILPWFYFLLLNIILQLHINLTTKVFMWYHHVTIKFHLYLISRTEKLKWLLNSSCYWLSHILIYNSSQRICQSSKN